jgi:hypothetical protein
MGRSRGQGDLQIEMLMLAFIGTNGGVDFLEPDGRGFVAYATVRRKRFGKAANSQVARTDVSRAAHHHLEREGLVQRSLRGITITLEGKTWLHQRVHPQIERDFLWRTITALERKQYSGNDLAWVALLCLSDAVNEHRDTRFTAACERLFYLYKALPARETNLLMKEALSKPPGPPYGTRPRG